MVCIIDIFRNQKIYNSFIITDATIINDNDTSYIDGDIVATVVPVEIYPLPYNNYRIYKIIKSIYDNELFCFILNGMLMCYSCYSIYCIMKLREYHQLYFIFFNTFVTGSYCCYRLQ